MIAYRRSALVLAVLLMVTACSSGTQIHTTTTTTTASTTSTTTTTVLTTTTTDAPDNGPLAAFLDAPVQDPLLLTGYHEMEYQNTLHTVIVSKDEIALPDGGVGRFGIMFLEPAPTVTGIAPDQKVVGVFIGPNFSTGVALYTLGADGWTAYATVDDTAVLAFLETTTDYDAKKPAAGGVAHTTVTTFDWAGGSAHFTGDVVVVDGARTAYEGQIECTLAGALECALLSDDGVLRPGDEGEDVSAMQSDLASLGYFTGAVTGTFDDDTRDAVRDFQRDYRLSVDGRAGPQTLGLLTEIIDGTSKIVMASQDGIGDVAFGTDAATALPLLRDIFGNPDAQTGWYVDGCDGHNWDKVTWRGFTAILTDRNGSRQFDGWAVDDLSDLPSWLYFVGGIRPSWTWSNFAAMGATWSADYGYAIWRHPGFGYNNGRFVVDPANPPTPGAEVKGFGTGTGGFSDC